MLKGKDKRYLRGRAAVIKASLQCGREGLTESFIDELKGALKRDELVKISVNKTAPMNAEDAAESCAAATGSEVVQVIGRKAVLYKRSEDNPVIVLPE